MTYFEGFVVPVPEANREAYRKSADAAPMFHEFGVTRMVEAWDGDVTEEGSPISARRSMPSPTRRSSSPGSNIRDQAARDAANEKMMSDPRMKEMGANMPFDGKRMIVGGFEPIVEEGSTGGGYTDGFVVPVPRASAKPIAQMAAKMAKVFRAHGATRVVEAIADDVKQGEVTDFFRAVKAEDGENVVF